MRKHSFSRRKTSAGSTLSGLFIGLVAGMLVAAAIVWYLNKTPVPFSGKNKTLTRQDSEQFLTPLPLPGKPGDPIPDASPDKPRFDFYKILPGNTAALPEPAHPSPPANGATQKPAASVTTPPSASSQTGVPDPRIPLSEPIFLQTGSFQTSGDADSQKARLAMMGIEASIQQVMLQDKVWYRVRVGPLNKSDDIASVRSSLAKQGIQANPVK
ncbi:MAG: SPOR domain-containing protein [Candidatus Accumulibacter sp.]|jgi:cell division protein FtsN|nr:SPOR domain-containing protein [Accumulibacter sp.]